MSRAHFGELFAELADPWEAARQSTLRVARGGTRKRAAGAGRKPKLVQVRPLLAAGGFAVSDRPGVRLRTPPDVFARAEAEAVELRLDGAETQVRRPQRGRPGRRAFVSGKWKQNTIKTTTFSDGQGRMLLSGVVRPGRMRGQITVPPKKPKGDACDGEKRAWHEARLRQCPDSNCPRGRYCDGLKIISLEGSGKGMKPTFA
ncbi:hypothetical protein [Streptomyces sp. YU58]|uniref:hypothetical protein n=1 Tax=Streptomyces sp. SX92 TaxID=3158972 RepID=UPI0027BA6E94|nr:hypothetical protein [Streptomyces coralus]WLW49855.1 hypothetical protein QU709_00085 [Streptomyces coralus]